MSRHVELVAGLALLVSVTAVMQQLAVGRGAALGLSRVSVMALIAAAGLLVTALHQRQIGAVRGR